MPQLKLTSTGAVQKISNLEKEMFWRDVFRQQAESGEPIAVFCRKNNLAESRYYYWRAKLWSKAGGSLSTPKFAELSLPEVKSSLPGYTAALPDDGIEIRLSSGHGLRIGPGVAVERLATIVKLLND